MHKHTGGPEDKVLSAVSHAQQRKHIFHLDGGPRAARSREAERQGCRGLGREVQRVSISQRQSFSFARCKEFGKQTALVDAQRRPQSLTHKGPRCSFSRGAWVAQ